MVDSEKSLVPVNPNLADLVSKLDTDHIILLVLKILNPDQPLYELAKKVWPDVGYAMRRRNIAESKVAVIIDYIAQRPYQLALLLNSKMMPAAVATLFEGLSANKENVRVTAAKEIIRLGQMTARQLSPDDAEPEPSQNLDNLLSEINEPIEGEFTVKDDEDSDGDVELPDVNG